MQFVNIISFFLNLDPLKVIAFDSPCLNIFNILWVQCPSHNIKTTDKENEGKLSFFSVLWAFLFHFLFSISPVFFSLSFFHWFFPHFSSQSSSLNFYIILLSLHFSHLVFFSCLFSLTSPLSLSLSLTITTSSITFILSLFLQFSCFFTSSR